MDNCRGKTADAATHTATIKFNKDANYTFAISYTDNADNKNTEPDVTGQTVPYEFTVDTTKPTGSVTVEANTWDKLLEVLTFGLYKNSTAKVSATADDDTSPVVIEYYKTSNATVMTEKSLMLLLTGLRLKIQLLSRTVFLLTSSLLFI